MYIFEEGDMASAIQKLQDAGFQRFTWSFGSVVDPATMAHDPILRGIHQNSAEVWASLDRNSVRFDFPPDSGIGTSSKIALLPSSYIGMALPTSEDDPNFDIEAGVYFPKAPVLLESIVRLRVKGDATELWALLLETWALTYLYGHLRLPDNVLDFCEDKDVVDWFNQQIRSFTGGRYRV